MEIDLSVTLPFTVFRIRLETAEGSISLVRSAVERPMSDEREQTSNAIHNLGDVTSKSGLRRLETFEAVSLLYTTTFANPRQLWSTSVDSLIKAITHNYPKSRVENGYVAKCR